MRKIYRPIQLGHIFTRLQFTLSAHFSPTGDPFFFFLKFNLKKAKWDCGWTEFVKEKKNDCQIVIIRCSTLICIFSWFNNGQSPVWYRCGISHHLASIRWSDLFYRDETESLFNRFLPTAVCVHRWKGGASEGEREGVCFFWGVTILIIKERLWSWQVALYTHTYTTDTAGNFLPFYRRTPTAL